MIYEMNHMWTEEMKWNEEMIVAVNAIYAIAQRSLKKIQDVKEMSVNDVWNESYVNCGNEMKWNEMKLHKLC